MAQLWSDKKRPIFGLPISFTKYTLTDEKLIIKTGAFTINEDEVRLYRITDMSLKQTLFDRIFKVGTIHVCSADKSCPEFDIMKIKNSRETKEMLSDVVENARTEKKVSLNEFITEDGAMHNLMND